MTQLTLELFTLYVPMAGTVFVPRLHCVERLVARGTVQRASLAAWRVPLQTARLVETLEKDLIICCKNCEQIPIAYLIAGVAEIQLLMFFPLVPLYISLFWKRLQNNYFVSSDTSHRRPCLHHATTSMTQTSQPYQLANCACKFSGSDVAAGTVTVLLSRGVLVQAGCNRFRTVRDAASRFKRWGVIL